MGKKSRRSLLLILGVLAVTELDVVHFFVQKLVQPLDVQVRAEFAKGVDFDVEALEFVVDFGGLFFGGFRFFCHNICGCPIYRAVQFVKSPLRF